jgi:hypothetical protein
MATRKIDITNLPCIAGGYGNVAMILGLTLYERFAWPRWIGGGCARQRVDLKAE